MKQLDNRLLNIIKENPNIINWNSLCKEYYIPYSIIIKNLKRISIRLLFTYQELPENFIEKYISKKDLLPIICQNQKLSTRFIFKYRHILDWDIMSFYQDLPEPLIRQFINKVNINEIVIRQNVSEQFLRDYEYMIDWEYVNSIYCKIINF